MNAIGVLVMCLLYGYGASLHADEVDEFIHSEMRESLIPGLALAVIHNGDVKKKQVYGFANAELEVPVALNTRFSIASITKTFTTAAILMLVDERKLELDVSIKRYLPELPDAWAPVTLRHCLSHTSGLPDTVTSPGNATPIADSEQEITEKIFSMKVSPPGQQSLYNQTGYMLSKWVIEKITKQRFEDYLQDQIFTPLNMRDTRFGDDRDVIPRLASSYTKIIPAPDRKAELTTPVVPGDLFSGLAISSDRIFKQQFVFPDFYHPSAGLVSTIEDMVKWDVALSEGRVVSASSLEDAGRAFKLSDGKNGVFGLGWASRQINGLQVMQMGGGWRVWHLRVPEKKLSVIVLTNLQGGERGEIAHGISNFYLDWNSKYPET